MGEVKREIRSQDAKLSEKDTEIRSQAETIDVQQRKLDEERAKVSELQKEVERIEKARPDRIHNDWSRTSDTSRRGGNGTDSNNGNISRTINVEATFYSAFCSTGCSGITATGLDVSSTIYTPEGLRVIAVDPNVIALGSTVRVTLANGDSFTAKASDTGGAIRGNRIDVLVSDEATAYSLGRQAATIEILSE